MQAITSNSWTPSAATVSRITRELHFSSQKIRQRTVAECRPTIKAEADEFICKVNERCLRGWRIDVTDEKAVYLHGMPRRTYSKIGGSPDVKNRSKKANLLHWTLYKCFPSQQKRTAPT